ncbi:MAG: TolB family protein [Chloroflexota bacterium]
MNRRRVFLAAGVLVVIVLGGIAVLALRLLSEPETVTLAQTNSIIAFTSNRDGGQWGIYIREPDGTIRRISPSAVEDNGSTCDASNLGEGPCAFDYFPSFSFDGEMINFLTNRNGTEMGPAQVRPDGSDFRPLDVVGAIAAVAVDQRFDWDPNWASTGWIGWSKIASLNLEIYVAGPGGDDERRLTSDSINGPRDWFMSWSPDGESITFSSDRAGTEDIYQVELDTVQAAAGPDDLSITRLTDNPVDDFHPAWSLDGESILFISDLEEGLLNGQIQFFLIDPDGGNQRPLGDDSFAGDIVYSADGTQAVYTSNESGTWSLYLLDVATGETVQITDDSGDDLFPVWGPVPAEVPAAEVDGS